MQFSCMHWQYLIDSLNPESDCEVDQKYIRVIQLRFDPEIEQFSFTFVSW